MSHSSSIPTPEDVINRRTEVDLLNWHECLKRCSPAFANNFIMQKLIPLAAIDDQGRAWLIRMSKLEAV